MPTQEPTDNQTELTANLFTEPQGATYLNTTPHSIKRWRYEGRLPYVKLGRQVRLRKSDLDAFIAANIEQASE